jgi:hypothetical protein
MSADSVALVRADTALPSPREWETMLSVAQNLVDSGLLPSHIKTPQAAVAIIMKGRELGIPAMYALSNIVVVQQKPTANAELMLALIYRDHGDEAIQIERTDAEACVLSYKRRSWTARRSFTFAIEDARRANLLKNPTWNSYPAAMLRARCISAVARAAFPDSIGGLYTPEELGARVAVEDGEAVVLAEAEAPAAGTLRVVQQYDPAPKDELARLREEIERWEHDRPNLVRRAEKKHGAWRQWDLETCRKALAWFDTESQALDEAAAQQEQAARAPHAQEPPQEASVGELVDMGREERLASTLRLATVKVAEIEAAAGKGRPGAGDIHAMRSYLEEFQRLDPWQDEPTAGTMTPRDVLPALKLRLAGYEDLALEETERAEIAAETTEGDGDDDRPF